MSFFFFAIMGQQGKDRILPGWRGACTVLFDFGPDHYLALIDSLMTRCLI